MVEIFFFFYLKLNNFHAVSLERLLAYLCSRDTKENQKYLSFFKIWKLRYIYHYYSNKGLICTFVLLYYFTVEMLYFCTVVLLKYCAIILLYRCTNELLYCCTIVLLYYCTVEHVHFLNYLKSPQTNQRHLVSSIWNHTRVGL